MTQCRVNYVALSKTVRTLTSVTYLVTLAACGWGYVVASTRFNSQVTLSMALTDTNLAIFQGVMATYYSAFSVLGILAEIRTERLKCTILRPFGFAHSWVGRGCFLLLIGVVFVVIPWDEERIYVNKVPASLQLAMGVIEIVIGVFVVKSPAEAVPGNASVSRGASIAWGEPEGSAGTPPRAESPRLPTETSADGTVSTTPSKRAVAAFSSNSNPSASSRFANPIHSPGATASLTAAPPGTNPF